jgi:uncharacterized membrane protein
MRTKGAAFVVTLLAYQFAMHYARGTPFGTALAIAPLAAAGIWFARRSQYRHWWWAGVVLAAAGLGIAGWYGYGALDAVYGAPHALIHLALLLMFAATLAPGREALCTGLARRAHGTLPPEIAGYTRRVTWAWCIYFAVMLALSLVLFVFASRSVWSLFTNVLTFPLLGLMFVAEYVYRRLRYPHFRHASILKGIELFAQREAHVPESARAH